MLVSFALLTIARALGETPEQSKPPHTVVVSSTPRLSRTIQRFESLSRDWIKCLRLQYETDHHPELGRLFARTARVMAGSAIVYSNMKMRTKKDKMEIATAPLVKILKDTRKAIISGQRITHMKEIQSWILPNEPFLGASPLDPEYQEYERRRRQNEKAHALVELRKKPVQCCMFVALSLFQFLYPDEIHDFVAEYEDEVISDTFNRTISIDDAKTYESLQMKHHCRERLTPPQDKIPIWDLPFGEIICVPRFVRNPMKCGAPIVSNQHRIERNEWEYINLNRNNMPQHIESTLTCRSPLGTEGTESVSSYESLP